MLPKNQPLVSIVTINWNSTSVTCEFLQSIKEHCAYKYIEVIVVDNASKKNPSSDLKKIFPEVQIILNKENLGFSGGNNVGIKASKGDYLFIVNNDTEFTPGLLEGLLEVFDQYPNTGVVCPKFHYFFQKGTIEYAGYNEVNIFTGRNSMVGAQQKDEGQYNEVSITNYAHGGGMMVCKKIITEVGLMPEDFFLYYEELDWCVSIRKKGYKIYYQPKSLIYHKESVSTGKLSPLKTFYLTRNRILFMRRNAPTLSLFIFFSYFILFTVPKNTVVFILKKQKEHLRSFWKGIFWHFNSNIKYNQG